jgi:hypothetical protein
MYSIISNLLSGSLLFILVVATPTTSMGQNITTITAKMEDKIEFQSYGKYEDPRMVPKSFQAINKKDIVYQYEIFLEDNYMKIYKNSNYITDSPVDSYEIKNGLYYFYSTFVPAPPYDHLVIDDVIIIDFKENKFFYSWYDPIADVTITQMGMENLLTND